jgi:hypothetical protein
LVAVVVCGGRWWRSEREKGRENEREIIEKKDDEGIFVHSHALLLIR